MELLKSRNSQTYIEIVFPCFLSCLVSFLSCLVLSMSFRHSAKMRERAAGAFGLELYICAACRRYLPGQRSGIKIRPRHRSGRGGGIVYGRAKIIRFSFYFRQILLRESHVRVILYIRYSIIYITITIK